MSVGMRRVCAWLIGAVCLLVVIALVTVASIDREVGESVSILISGVTALIGLAVSVVTLLMNPTTATQTPVGRIARIRARGQGSIAAGGDIRGNAIGKGSKVTDPTHAVPATRRSAAPERDVVTKGTGALSAGGDIVDNALGEDSER